MTWSCSRSSRARRSSRSSTWRWASSASVCRTRTCRSSLAPAAKSVVAEKGFDPVLGARPLRRTIQRDIEDVLSEKILFGQVHVGDTILVDAEGEGLLGELTFSRRTPDGTVEPISENIDLESVTQARSEEAHSP